MVHSKFKKILHKIAGPEEPVTAFFGIDAIIMLASTAAMAWVFLTFATSLGNILHRQYINIAFYIPKLWTASGEPNSSMVVYAITRDMIILPAFFIIGFVVLFAVILDVSKITNGMTRKLVWKVTVAMVIVIALPLFWDPMAETLETSALSIASLTYSFDPTNPCKNPMPEALLPLHAENMKIAQRIHGDYEAVKDLDVEDLACSPQLRVTYLFSKALKGATDFGAANPDDIGDQFYTALGNTQKTFLFDFMGGITRATMVAFLTIFSGIVLIGKTLWIQSLLTIFPPLFLMSTFPIVGDFAKKMLKMIPGLLLCGVIVASVILAGSTTLSMMEDGIANGEPLFGIKGYTFIETMGDVQDSNVLSSTNGADMVFNNTIVFWFTAVAALALASTIPLMMVPELGGLASMVGQMAGSGLISGAMTMSQVVGGAVKGGGNSMANMAGVGAGAAATSGVASNMFAPKGMSVSPSKDAMGAIGSGAGGKAGGKGGIGQLAMGVGQGAAMGAGQGMLTDANNAARTFNAGSIPGASEASRQMDIGNVEGNRGGGYFGTTTPAVVGSPGVAAAGDAAGSNYSVNHGDRAGGADEGLRMNKQDKIPGPSSSPPTGGMDSNGDSVNVARQADEIKQDMATRGAMDATAKINYEAGSIPPLDNLPGVDVPIKPAVMPEMSGAPMDVPPGSVQPPGPLYSRTMSADWS